MFLALSLSLVVNWLYPSSTPTSTPTKAPQNGGKKRSASPTQTDPVPKKKLKIGGEAAGATALQQPTALELFRQEYLAEYTKKLDDNISKQLANYKEELNAIFEQQKSQYAQRDIQPKTFNRKNREAQTLRETLLAKKSEKLRAIQKNQLDLLQKRLRDIMIISPEVSANLDKEFKKNVLQPYSANESLGQLKFFPVRQRSKSYSENAQSEPEQYPNPMTAAGAGASAAATHYPAASAPRIIPLAAIPSPSSSESEPELTPAEAKRKIKIEINQALEDQNPEITNLLKLYNEGFELNKRDYSIESLQQIKILNEGFKNQITSLIELATMRIDESLEKAKKNELQQIKDDASVRLNKLRGDAGLFAVPAPVPPAPRALFPASIYPQPRPAPATAAAGAMPERTPVSSSVYQSFFAPAPSASSSATGASAQNPMAAAGAAQQPILLPATRPPIPSPMPAAAAARVAYPAPAPMTEDEKKFYQERVARFSRSLQHMSVAYPEEPTPAPVPSSSSSSAAGASSAAQAPQAPR